MTPKRLFLSYSVKDDPGGRHFVRTLLTRLREQEEIDPWIYESSAGQIRAGDSITQVCRDKIESADIFVFLITDAAIASDYVGMEVAHALWVLHARREPLLKAMPLIATAQPPSHWPHQIVELADRKGLVLLQPIIETVETVVQEVCQSVGVGYRPPGPVTPRLPLARRLMDELGAYKASTDKDVEEYGRLMQCCEEAVEAFNKLDYDGARTMLGVLAMLLKSYKGFTPYYPRIVQATVAMAEAHAGKGSFADVERQFTALIDTAGKQLDANAYAGRGNARMALGRFREAMHDYQEADRLLDAPDPALFYNMVRARALGRIPLERATVDSWRHRLVEGITTQTPGDGSRLCAVLSLAYAYMADSAAALEAWERAEDQRDIFPEIVLDIGQHLHRHAMDMPARADAYLACAETIIEQYLAQIETPDADAAGLFLLHQIQARIAYDSGDRRRGRSIAEQLCARHPSSPVALMDAAILALADGDLGRAREHCSTVLQIGDYARCMPKVSYNDLSFYRGQACWLLGRAGEARQCFEQSGYPAEHAYHHTMAGDLGRLQ